MISNERPSPYGQRGPDPRYSKPPTPRPFVQEDTLKTAELQIERKLFVVLLKENPRGRFLRISEETAGKRNTIIIPAPGLKDFVKLLDEMVGVSGDTPPKG